ncbi:hypothetical protein LOTGIDRAFT_159497 [Lottia gigantea]|uniref:Uncharacterized protein n=1 Tax=Lottia gigantea TaxID=225164 RepID=V4C719_LOTGI|nr:hypothetical protein LOTGIDRAFT_159497 [Lottia gigantea]ESO97464.1 hypothetical protein LOTGIDRAFT_159497 [Lottia gigantea]
MTLEKKESSTAISSLLSQYGDVSDEEMPNDGSSAVDNISDEEVDHLKHKLHAKVDVVEDENSSSSIKDPGTDTPVKKKAKKTALVSYVGDDHEEDKSSSESERTVEDIDDYQFNTSKGGSCLETEVACK